MGWWKKLFGTRSDPPPYVTAVQGVYRFAVVRRPLDTLEYGGFSGAAARQTFEALYANRGETVEIWEWDVCRGRK